MTVAIDSPFTAEELEPTLRPLLEASLLPARAYTDDAVAEWERRNLFLGGWVCVGHVGALAERGAYLTSSWAARACCSSATARASARGFFNVCRHRGVAAGLTSPRARCGACSAPTTRGATASTASLKNAPHTDELIDFDPACNGLQPVRTEVAGGLVFADVSGVAPPLADHVGVAGEHLDAYRNGELRARPRIDYDVAANWKAIVENYSECLHCPGVHPELNRLSHYLSGDDFEGPGAWCGGSMTLTKGADTMATNGGHPAGRRSPACRRPARRPVLRDLPELPGLAAPGLRDAAHAVAGGAGPHGGRLRVVLRARDDGAPGFDGSDAVEFWDLVNRQDWEVCELTQLGIGSPGYTPGRYTEVESTVHDFDRMVAEAYLR